MGRKQRKPCWEKEEVNRGAWTAEEDRILTDYVKANGDGRWETLPSKAGLNRCGKSCRLRWRNYLRPGIKRGNISPEEEELIIKLHRLLGNRWSLIAGRLPGRTDNEIKNYWNSVLSKRALKGKDRKHDIPEVYRPRSQSSPVWDKETTVPTEAFWASILECSVEDTKAKISNQNDDYDNNCFGFNNGEPGPHRPYYADTTLISENIEVKTSTLFSRFHQGEDVGGNAGEDPVMKFDFEDDVLLLDLLNSDILAGGNPSSSLPPLADILNSEICVGSNPPLAPSSDGLPCSQVLVGSNNTSSSIPSSDVSTCDLETLN
ncbi:hypothetical protein SAY86_009887 [Trapa natans]|uniref:Uncharacterized protein n=1 Tax=Trapa natans TaxID=22666 RepID=A0AAN7L5M4_TRANT|nr:hypothetical protein SAY86_009887 [Trapa natans]